MMEGVTQNATVAQGAAQPVPAPAIPAPNAALAAMPPLLERRQYSYTISCDMRHKRPTPEESTDDVIIEGNGEDNERPRKRLRVHPGETDSEDDETPNPTDESTIPTQGSEDGSILSRDAIEHNIERLARLIEPLEKIKRDTDHFGSILQHQHGSCLNNDFGPLVAKIGSGIDELHRQLVGCRSFYTFLLHARRPVQAEWGYFGMLPSELVLKIFSFLEEGRDLAVLQCVCTLFHKVASDTSLWKALCMRHWAQDIALGQKPANRPWRWLFDCKVVWSSLCTVNSTS